MVFAPHYRVTALGRLGDSPERFSYSVNMAKGDASPLPFLNPNDDVYADIAAEVKAFHGSPAMLISGYAVLEEVKIAHIGADGRYVTDAVIVDVADQAGGVPSSPGVDFVAPQVALAVSLGTDRRGASGRGRFYLPMPTTPMGSQFVIPDVARDAAQARLATFVESLGNQPGFDVLDLRVVVASTKGFNTSVTSVRVGRVLDTVRSRRRSILEDYDPPTPVNQGG